MRAKTALLILMLAAIAPARALAQQAQPAKPAPAAPQAEPAEETPLDADLRSVDFGVRFGDVSGDEARYMRYRDLRSGVILDSARYTQDKGTRLFHAEVDHLGYRDQRYSASIEQFGKVKAWFEWNQIPYFNSITTVTPYTVEGPGVLRIDDAVQQRIQSGQGTVANTLVPIALPFDTRVRRDIADFGFGYQLPKQLDAKFYLTTTKKTGEQPWGDGFGFSYDFETPVPIDTRTTDLGASVEWSNQKYLARIGYDGSWFSNENPSLTWDSPLRITDASGSPSQGRMALWPGSTVNTISATGSVALPARSRATAYVSRGAWSADEALLPHTINTALASPPLERSSTEADADVTALMLRFNSRPKQWFWFNANYRYYDFDNQTPSMHIPQYVKYDSSIGPTTIPDTEPLSFTRKLFDAEGSFTPWANGGALRVGYTREDVDRSFRHFETTTDNQFKLSYDVTNVLSWMTLRASYLRASRTGEGLDEEVLDDIGEQVSLRQFDISPRDRNVASLLVTVLPSSLFSVYASIGGGTDDRPDTQFGLSDSSYGVYEFGVDSTPSDGLSFAASYGLETYGSLSKSRQASSEEEFNDPRRDWTMDADETVHHFNANADILKAFPRTTISVGYELSKSKARFFYGVAPNSTLTPPTQLAPIHNDWYLASVDVAYSVRRNWILALRYQYERFFTDDFAFVSSTLNRIDLPSTFILGRLYSPYTANTVWLKMRYLW